MFELTQVSCSFISNQDSSPLILIGTDLGVVEIWKPLNIGEFTLLKTLQCAGAVSHVVYEDGYVVAAVDGDGTR